MDSEELLMVIIGTRGGPRLRHWRPAEPFVATAFPLHHQYSCALRSLASLPLFERFSPAWSFRTQHLVVLGLKYVIK